jgi:hypothetical protein
MKFTFIYNGYEIWATDKKDAFKKFKLNWKTNCIKSVDQITLKENSGFSYM